MDINAPRAVIINKMQTFARQAQLASAAHETLKVTPEVAGLLAVYLQEAITSAEDQAWFWSAEWQAGERAAEADLLADRYEIFDDMEDLIVDVGWSQ